MLSHPRLLALWAGCRGRCGASGVGRSPTRDCPPSGRAAGAGLGRPGSGALPPPTARPLGGLPGPVWGVRGRTLSHPRLPALWAGCRGQCGASGVGRSPTPDCPPSGRAAGAGVGRPGSNALPPPTARPLGGLPGPVWGVRGRVLPHPRLPALWAGCRGRCGASGVGRSPTPDCPHSGRAAGAGVGRPGSGALPPPTARPLGGLPGPVWGVRGRALSHPRLPALWAGCRGRCGASGVGRSPTPDCSPSGRAAGAGVGRPGSDALPPPTARPLGGLRGPVWGVRGRTLSHPRLPALWAGCQGRCGASGVGRSPTPDCPPSGRAAGAVVGRPGSGALPPPTARPLGGLLGPVWGVRGRTLSHPRLPTLWAGCRGRCGASGVGRSPTADCPPSGRAAGAGLGRPGSDALPPPTACPLGGLRVPVWGVRGRARSHPRLLALWTGCGGRCGASGVGRSPTPDCSPSGRAAGAGVGRPGSDALPPPTSRPLGRLPAPVWGVRGRTLSHPRLPALWAGCRGQCGAYGVGRLPTPNCPPSGRAAGAGVGRPGSDALPPPTACPLGGLPGPVWGVRGRALSHPRLPALWAGCRGRCGASGVGRSPTPDCSPSGRAAGAGVGGPGSDALPPPTAHPLGGLPGPVWGVRGRALSHPRLPTLWTGCRGRFGASGVRCSPTPDCLPSRRAAGAGVGRPGSGALPPPTARPLDGLPGPVWGVRGRALSHPRLLALWAGCRGRCGASGVGRSHAPDCPPSGRAAGAGVGRPGSGALPSPTARPLGGLLGPVSGVRGRALSHPRLLALWAGCRGRCGASGVGRSHAPDCPPSGRAAGAGVGRPGSDTLPPPTARPLGGLPGPVWGVRGWALSHPRLLTLWAGCRGRCGHPGSDALPPAIAGPLRGLPGPVWGVRGRALSHPRLLALWAGRRGRCGASGVGRSPTPDCPPSGRAAGAGVGRPGSDALPSPTARPLGGLPGPVWGVRVRALSHPRLPALWAGCRGPCGASRVGRSPTPDCPPSGRVARAGVGRPGSGAVRVRALLGRVGRASLPGAFWCASPFLWPFLLRSLLVRPPPGWGCPVCGCCWVFLPVVAPPPLFFFFPSPPSVRPVVSCFACFPAWGALGLGVLLPPPFFVFFGPPPLPVVTGVSCFPGAFGLCAPPPPFFFLSCCFFSCCASALCVLGCRAVCSLSCPFVVLCASSVLFLVAGVVGSWCRCLMLGVCWWLWLPGVVVWWCVSALVPVSGLAVAGRPPCGVPFPCAVSCGAVLPCCCALCRLALRCCALCCFVLLRLVLLRAVLCPGALSFILGSCAFWRRVLSCPPALRVFCCGVSLRGVVRRCALCRVRPGVSCCAFLVVSALCGVAVWPALPRCPASLCCGPWCCAAAWCRGVLSCRLAGFVSRLGVVVPTHKTAAKFRKIFFSSFFGF